jgi:alpha/beta superfamily hydrolase
MVEEAVTIPFGDFTLEGYLGRPEGGPASGGVVVCHPHPSYGGDMNSHVVTTICRSAAAAGLAALRFNFRGTGRSGGVHSGGRLEHEDVQAAVDFLIDRAQLAPGTVGVAGYSFGSIMALVAGVPDDRVAALAAISPPIGMRPIPNLATLTKPLLIVSGENDSVAPADDLQDIGACYPDRIELHVIEDEDHFWWNSVGDVGRLTGEFFKKYLIR